MTRVPLLKIPQAVPQQTMRATQDTVPPTREQREHLNQLAQAYVQKHKPVPPMPLSELQVHAELVLKMGDVDPKFLDFTAVLINNAMWRDQLAAVPYERRLLLLPKCMRVEAKCPAPFDEFGLLCKQCGLCSIQDLQEEAERLGYAVLVAEGSAIVMKIIETGKIDAIVGVSCLSVLEKSFPFMEAAAVPGVAIPLLQDDCADTNVDMEWVWDVVHVTSDDKTYRLDLDTLKRDAQTWFSAESLDAIMGPAEGRTAEIGREWLARDGKRWRPFLAACAYKAMLDDPGSELPEDFLKIAVAVECFHKASLIHDDIEDEDEERYGQATLHAEHGVAVALNVGDYLLGEGYRMIGDCGAEGSRIAAMLRVASEGHRDLCLGQGAELCWARNPAPMKSVEVLDIFRQKTAPAFDVALKLGAIYGGADEETLDAVGEYSESLGIAYQIRDDLEDWLGGEGTSDLEAMRPTLLPAIAHERARGADKELLDQLWTRKIEDTKGLEQRLRNVFVELGVEDRARRLYDSYKEEAIRSLRFLDNATLKGLLRRVMTKIFNDLQIKGWCKSESEASDASGREAGQESAA